MYLGITGILSKYNQMLADNIMTRVLLRFLLFAIVVEGGIFIVGLLRCQVLEIRLKGCDVELLSSKGSIALVVWSAPDLRNVGSSLWRTEPMRLDLIPNFAFAEPMLIRSGLSRYRQKSRVNVLGLRIQEEAADQFSGSRIGWTNVIHGWSFVVSSGLIVGLTLACYFLLIREAVKRVSLADVEGFAVGPKNERGGLRTPRRMV